MNLDRVVENNPTENVYRLMVIADPFFDGTAEELRREIIARKCET